MKIKLHLMSLEEILLRNKRCLNILKKKNVHGDVILCFMISKIIKALNDYGMKVSVYDPWAEPKEVMHEYGLEITNTLPTKQFEAMVLGVAHAEFTNLDFKLLLKKDAILYDVKGTLKGDLVDGKL